MESKYLISKYWYDPFEKNNSQGYKPVGYVDTLEEATKIKMEAGFFTEKDISVARYMHDGKIWKMSYEEIKPYNHKPDPEPEPETITQKELRDLGKNTRWR